jgi:hypothetical protein
MAFANLFSSLAARLFGAAPQAAGGPLEPELVSMGVEAVVDAVDPRLRALSGYARKVAPPVTRTIAHLRELGPLLPQPIALTRGAWAEDPLLNAFFATADDVPLLLARSAELKGFFQGNPGAADAYALLGMLKTEREVFAPAIVDGALRQDVAQTTVSFSQHRLICPAADEAGCRREVGVRILRRLAALALQRITALEELSTELEQRKALLNAKLRLLHLRSNGLEQIVQEQGSLGAQIDSIERELKTTLDEYLETKASAQTLEARLYQIEAVFGAPAEHVKLERVALRVSRLGYKVPAGSGEPASELALHELSLGDGLKAVIALVRCPRAGIPSPESLAARGTQALL